MLKFFRNEKGFTLVELMIVVVIVGILAAVAIPMYKGSTDRARASEAVAALGSIRSAERVYFAEHATYFGAEDSLVAPNATANDLDLTQADLSGRYFSSNCYTFSEDATATTYRIACAGSLSTTGEATSVAHILRFIDEDGEITKLE